MTRARKLKTTTFHNVPSHVYLSKILKCSIYTTALFFLFFSLFSHVTPDEMNFLVTNNTLNNVNDLVYFLKVLRLLSREYKKEYSTYFLEANTSCQR